MLRGGQVTVCASMTQAVGPMQVKRALDQAGDEV